MPNLNKYLDRSFGSALGAATAPFSGRLIGDGLKAKGRAASLVDLKSVKQELANKAFERVMEEREKPVNPLLNKHAQDENTPALFYTDDPDPPLLPVRCGMERCVFNQMMHCSKADGPIIVFSVPRGTDPDTTMCQSYSPHIPSAEGDTES